MTSTRSPGWSLPWSRSPWSAVNPAIPIVAASSNVTLGGFRTTLVALTYSANAPFRPPNTSSPGARSVTSFPTASTTPAKSVPSSGLFGRSTPLRVTGRRKRGQPRSWCQSALLIELARTRTSTRSSVKRRLLHLLDVHHAGAAEPMPNECLHHLPSPPYAVSLRCKMTYSVSYVNGDHQTQAAQPRAHPRRGARPRRRAGHRRALDAQARPGARRLRGDVPLQPRREQGRPARRDPRPRARGDGAAGRGRRPARDPGGSRSRRTRR